MKLELKHLAPYLPYGLEMKYKGGNAIEQMEAHHLAINYEYNFKDRFEIILRPLSELLNDAYIKDNFPCEYYLGWAIEKDGDNVIGFRTPESWLDLKVWMPFYQYLFEGHYDVFGLIEKGLAIDINTLKDA